MKPAMPAIDPAEFSPAVYHGPPAVPGVVWHYTHGFAAKRIVADCALKPQPQGCVGRTPPPGTKPLLWFSKNHVWEPAAARPVPGLTFEWHGLRLPKAFTFEGQQQAGTRLVRFAVSMALAPYSHHAAYRLAGFSTGSSRLLAQAGEQLGGHIDDWRASLVPITQAQWLAIEIWRPQRCDWEVVWTP